MRNARTVGKSKIESLSGSYGTEAIQGHGVETVCGVQI